MSQYLRICCETIVKKRQKLNTPALKHSKWIDWNLYENRRKGICKRKKT